MSGRGAGDRPLTYAGEYDATRTYLARQVVTSGGSVYMAVAMSVGQAPPNATYWLPLGGSAGGAAFFRDRFVLASTGPQNKVLSYTPTAYSQHVYLNGIALDESVDYTLSAATVSLLTAAGAVSGDILDVRYAIGGAAPALTGYPGAVVTDGPAFFLRLGEASGTTAVDSSGNGHDGTYTNSPTLGTTGLLVGDADTCVTFDGTNDYVTIPYGSWMNTSAITVEAIIQTTASGAYRNIIDRDDTSGRVFQFRMNSSNKLELVLINGSAAFCASSTSINDGAPHHVAATYDGANMRLYIDGVADGVTATGLGLSLGSSGVGMLIGANASSGIVQFWSGQIDEAAYYTTALSAGQIAAHFAASGL